MVALRSKRVGRSKWSRIHRCLTLHCRLMEMDTLTLASMNLFLSLTRNLSKMYPFLN